jgi:hypothetical protein
MGLWRAHWSLTDCEEGTMSKFEVNLNDNGWDELLLALYAVG